MSKKIKVIFIGGLTNGVFVLEYLTKNKYVSIPLVFTHPQNFDFPRYSDLGEIFDDKTEIIRDMNIQCHVKMI